MGARALLLWLLMTGCDGGESKAPPVAVTPSVPSSPLAVQPLEVAPEPLKDPLVDLPTPLARGTQFRRGISLGLFVSTEDEKRRRNYYRRFIREIAQLGATDIQLVVQWGQHDVEANAIAPVPGMTTDDGLLRWVLQEAKRAGLRVFLMPILHLAQRAKGQWRGTLAPTDWPAWWESYRRFILHYAGIAQAEGVDLFAVGSELVSTESQSERWLGIIGAVRQEFKGQLTYSANWDHFEPVGFWDALDVAGMTGYMRLSTARHPDEATLMEAWLPLLAQVARWRARTGKDFLFTEIGYPAQPYAARDPWDYRPTGAPDSQLQLRCYRAMFRSLHAVPGLAGLYVWNWFGHGGAQDAGYTPRGKPAARVLSHWYGAAPPPTKPQSNGQ